MVVFQPLVTEDAEVLAQVIDEALRHLYFKNAIVDGDLTCLNDLFCFTHVVILRHGEDVFSD